MTIIEHFIAGRRDAGVSTRRAAVFDLATGDQSGEVILAGSEDATGVDSHALRQPPGAV